MSITLDFHQIEKENVLSENKIFGMYELPFEDLKNKRSVYMDPDIIQELYDDANKWDEVYFQPFIPDFLFFLLAVNFEMEIGFKIIDGKHRIVAFDPKVILKFINEAIRHSQYGRDGAFDQVKTLVEEAIDNDWLIYCLYM